MNNQLLDMYSRRKNNPVPEENELIDISSDDETTEPVPKTLQTIKTSNGSTTIIAVPGSLIKPEVVEKKTEKEESPPQDRGKKRKSDAISSTTNKKKKEIITTQESKVTFKDIAGIDDVLEEVCKLLLHIQHPEVYKQIGISAPRGFLLHGPPGCGKTLLASSIAGVIIHLRHYLYVNIIYNYSLMFFT